MARWSWLIAVTAAASVLSACQPSAPSVDRATTAAAEEPSAAAAPASAAPNRLNLDAIFPPGPGRDLVLNNCTSCHTIVPIVILQMSKDAWELNAREHRDRVTSLSDAEVATLYAYLAANFNPDRPVPELPRELLDTWTSY